MVCKEEVRGGGRDASGQCVSETGQVKEFSIFSLLSLRDLFAFESYAVVTTETSLSRGLFLSSAIMIVSNGVLSLTVDQFHLSQLCPSNKL